MKKTLIALAALSALVGTAHAQSNVTVYGLFDGGLRNLTNVNAAGDSKLTMSSGGTYHSNRFGFRGTEDLGNGLQAIFQLEGGYNSGTGVGNTGLFDRTAKVGISGAYGTVSLGRQYTVAYDVNTTYDPVNHKYSGITPVANASIGTRNDNAIVYLGTFNGFTVRAGHAAGEVAGSTSNGSTDALGLNYDNGPVSVGGVYTQKKDVLGTGRDLTNYSVGGAYKIDAFKLTAGYVNEKVKVPSAADTTAKYTWAGVGYQATPALELIAAFYQTKSTVSTGDGKKDMFLLSSVYSLSKRTLVYGEIDHSKVTGTTRFSNASSSTIANTNNNQVGVSAGVVHYF
jgi:predicted porin